MATITIEFADGTVAYLEVTEEQADWIATMIEEELNTRMNLKT